jgi:Fur family iron response transcriptional regulator
MARPYAGVIESLRRVGLRPTRQRAGLGHLLFRNGDRHVTADQLYAEAEQAGLRVSLATVYNTLHQLCAAGLLAEVVVEPGRSYFDTNVAGHHHFYNVDTGGLTDIMQADVGVPVLPPPPAGTTVEQVSIIVRVRNESP